MTGQSKNCGKKAIGHRSSTTPIHLCSIKPWKKISNFDILHLSNRKKNYVYTLKFRNQGQLKMAKEECNVKVKWVLRKVPAPLDKPSAPRTNKI